LCTVLSLFVLWPQVFRVRGGNVEGLNVPGALHGLSAALIWTTYSWFIADPALGLSNGQGAIAMGFVLTALIRAGKVPLRTVAAVAIGVLGCSIAVGVWNSTVIGSIGVVIGASSIIPQTVSTLRDRRALEGISVTTYRMIVTVGSLWIVYGILQANIIIVLPNLLLVPCAAVIGVIAQNAQREKRRQDAALAQ
jgi:uncharacterized protein with PQ loop repeat